MLKDEEDVDEEDACERLLYARNEKKDDEREILEVSCEDDVDCLDPRIFSSYNVKIS